MTTPTPSALDTTALAVLARAARTGYVLIGPHDRVCRLDTTTPSRPRAVEIGRDEHDTVHALAVSGLLHPADSFTVDDHGQTRRGHGLRLTHHGRRALDTADTPTPACRACRDTGLIPDANYPTWSPVDNTLRRRPSSTPCHRCPAGPAHTQEAR